MTQEEITQYASQNNLTLVDGETNIYLSKPVNTPSSNGDISVRTLFGFNVGDATIYKQIYRDAPQNYAECMRMLKDNMDSTQ